MSNQNKRDRLVDSAAALFHHNGITATSLADIAKHADIPIGNVYYYFKTKEELAMAAIGRRKEQFAALYAGLEESEYDPRQRLIQAIAFYASQSADYTRYGCPIGKIIDDADIEKDVVAQAAAQLLNDAVDWAQRQFQQLGHSAEARKYALSLMAGIQGGTLMAKATCSSQVFIDEMTRLTHWVEHLPNRKIQLGKVGAKSSDSANAA